jgi:hypothetical protein
MNHQSSFAPNPSISHAAESGEAQNGRGKGDDEAHW